MMEGKETYSFITNILSQFPSFRIVVSSSLVALVPVYLSKYGQTQTLGYIFNPTFGFVHILHKFGFNQHSIV